MRVYPKRKSNGERVWWASWSEPHPITGRTVTRRRSTECSTKAAAEIVITRWERERADPVYAAANEATFGVEAGRFLISCEGAVERKKMAPETLGMYREKTGTLVRILGADTRLASIDGATFAAYIEARRRDFRESTTTAKRPDGKAITESTLYKEWVAFRGVLKQAWRAQRFGRDPASLKPAHFGPEYEPRKTALSWAEVMLLVTYLTGDRARAVAFVVATGARRSEVFRAAKGDLDTKAWTVHLRGKKTSASNATLPIVSLMRHLAAMAPPPFPAWGNARRDLELACAAIGIPRVTWNDLRRTFCSLLVQAGVAPHLAAKLMRHKSTAMVDRVYGRQTIESLANLVEAQIREPQANHKAPE